MKATAIKGKAHDELSNAAKSETHAREWFTDWWKRGARGGKPGLTWIEFALGGSPGAPDVLVPIEGKLVACELKLGEFRGTDGAMLVKFRPSQINWHTEMAAGGVKTYAFIATRMGTFCVRGKDVRKFASGEYIDWPTIASNGLGEITSFFLMMENEKQHAESIANYKRNADRIEREMGASIRNRKGLIAEKPKSISKPQAKTARAGTASTPAAVAQGKAKAQAPVKPISKAKSNWPKPIVQAAKSQTAPKTRATNATVVAAKQVKAKSTPQPAKGKPR